MDMLLVKEIGETATPDQRLLRQGAERLTNAELLAIILRTGTRALSAVEVATEVLQQVEHLQALRHVTLEELRAVPGVSNVKALQLLAVVELGRRLAQKPHVESYTIRSPADAAAYVMAEMTGLLQEHFVALFLNVKNQIIYQKTVFVGSLNSSIVHPRELVRP